MIREIRREEIPECVRVIRRSHMTVADEFGFTPENAPRYVAFATDENRLTWQMDHEHRLMFLDEEGGVICGFYSLLLKPDSECELGSLSVLPEYRHQGFGTSLLNHAVDTARKQNCRIMNLSKTPCCAGGMNSTGLFIRERRNLTFSLSPADT